MTAPTYINEAVIPVKIGVQEVVHRGAVGAGACCG